MISKKKRLKEKIVPNSAYNKYNSSNNDDNKIKRDTTHCIINYNISNKTIFVE